MSQGKGSNPRPLTISQDEYARRWALAFGSEEALEEAVANADLHYALKKAEQEEKSVVFEAVRVPLGLKKGTELPSDPNDEFYA